MNTIQSVNLEMVWQSNGWMTLQSNFDIHRNPIICDAAVKLTSVSSSLHSKLTHTHTLTHSTATFLCINNTRYCCTWNCTYSFLTGSCHLGCTWAYTVKIQHFPEPAFPIPCLLFYYLLIAEGEGLCSCIFWKFPVRMSAGLSYIFLY